MASCTSSTRPKAASTFTPLGFSFWSQNRSHVKHCLSTDRKRKAGVGTATSSCTSPMDRLDDRTKVEAVFLVWDSAEKEGGGFLLPCIDGDSWYTHRFGDAYSNNIGWGIYAGLAVAILWMDEMQVQFHLESFVDNLPLLKSDEWFPNLKYIVGSGTCSTFCDPLGTICVSSTWVNGFTQTLASDVKVSSAAKQLGLKPTRGIGTIYLAKPQRISTGVTLSATDNTNPGPTCDPPSCEDNDDKDISCYAQNQSLLASTSGFDSAASLADYLSDTLGLHPEEDAPDVTPRHLETDDYYVQAVASAKMEGVQVFTSRAVTDNYCASFPCPPGQGFSSTYHKIWLTQSAILTGIKMIVRLGQHTPIAPPIVHRRNQGPPPYLKTCYC